MLPEMALPSLPQVSRQTLIESRNASVDVREGCADTAVHEDAQF